MYSLLIVCVWGGGGWYDNLTTKILLFHGIAGLKYVISG